MLLKCTALAVSLEPVRIDPVTETFVIGDPPRPFIPWGLNYGNTGRLIEDFWGNEWPTLEEDFREMKSLGANVVRVHLQFSKFMQNATQANEASLQLLGKLLALAEQTGLYLDLTGLACYRTEDVPKWYDAMNESERWQAQSVFWSAVAKICAGNSVVFCYDLMNEPLSPGGKRAAGDWYSGKKLGDYDFLQMISLGQGDRPREEVARQWIRKLREAIRAQDARTLITVGMLPTARGWGHLSGFIPAQLAGELDFISGHLYPESGRPDDVIERTKTFDVGKPMVIEETFAYTCSPEELAAYLPRSARWAEGWMMHYDGETIEQLEALKTTHQLTMVKAAWLGSLKIFKLGPPSTPVDSTPDFALRDGDVCVFLGDSITAAHDYGKLIENYTLLRFPERGIRFLNAGKGGETAAGSLERLDKAVLDQGATVVTVAYGVNDIGWGMKADAEHKAAYLDGIGKIVDRCQARGVRVFICSPAITAEAPDTAEKGFLQTMTDEGMALAKSKGAGTIDIQRGMRAIQRRVLLANEKERDVSKQTKLHVQDGVHLNELGQMAMGFVILKGLGAPAEVSSAEIDAASGSIVSVRGCLIDKIEHSGSTLSFTRTDERLPMNLQPLWMLNSLYIPFGELNQYKFTVKNLPAGRYVIDAGSRSVGTFSADQLGRGVDLSSATTDGWQPGNLWAAQGHTVKKLTDMRDLLKGAESLMETTFEDHPQRTELEKAAAEIEERVTALQRAISKPQAVRFTIKPEVK